MRINNETKCPWCGAPASGRLFCPRCGKELGTAAGTENGSGEAAQDFQSNNVEVVSQSETIDISDSGLYQAPQTGFAGGYAQGQAARSYPRAAWRAQKKKPLPWGLISGGIAFLLVLAAIVIVPPASYKQKGVRLSDSAARSASALDSIQNKIWDNWVDAEYDEYRDTDDAISAAWLSAKSEKEQVEAEKSKLESLHAALRRPPIVFARKSRKIGAAADAVYNDFQALYARVNDTRVSLEDYSSKCKENEDKLNASLQRLNDILDHKNKNRKNGSGEEDLNKSMKSLDGSGNRLYGK